MQPDRSQITKARDFLKQAENADSVETARTKLTEALEAIGGGEGLRNLGFDETAIADLQNVTNESARAIRIASRLLLTRIPPSGGRRHTKKSRRRRTTRKL